MPFNVSGNTVITDDRLFVLTSGTSRPASPVVGMIFFNTSTSKVEVWNGAEWKQQIGIVGSGEIPSAWSFGSNTNGKLGDNTTTNRSSPVSIVGGYTDWIQVSAGGVNHSLGLRADGTAWAWGNNDNGRLGDNSTSSRLSPVSVVGGFTDWTELSAGGTYSLGIRANGTAYGWGLNTVGQLGDNSTSSRLSPVSVVGNIVDWIQVSAGTSHSLGLRANGTAYGWGFNSNGELGDASTSSRLSPVIVVGGFTNWVQVSAGDNHSLGLRANGIAYGWGANSDGRLGDNTTVGKSSPVSVTGGITNWVQVSAGSHSLGLRSNGDAYAWGGNSAYELGDRTTSSRSSPVITGYRAPTGAARYTFYQIDAGSVYSIGLTISSTITGWGINSGGNLGDGTTSSRSWAETIALGGFTDWVYVSAGDHTLALRSQPRIQNSRPDLLRNIS